MSHLTPLPAIARFPEGWGVSAESRQTQSFCEPLQLFLGASARSYDW